MSEIEVDPEITEDTVCLTAFGGKNPSPTGTVPKVKLLAEEDRNGLTDLGKMNEVHEEYQGAIITARDLHLEWAALHDLWVTRSDLLYARSEVIERRLAGSVGVVPSDDYEEFGLFDFGVVGGAIVTVFSAGIGLFQAIKGLKEVAQQAENARRTKLLYGGMGVVSVIVAALGVYVAIRQISEKVESLIRDIPRFHEWLYGYEGDEDNKVLFDPNDLADADIGGVYGEIEGLKAGIGRMVERVTNVAVLLEVPVTELVDGNEVPRNPHVIYCEVQQKLLETMNTAGAVEGATNIAIRMLCLDENDATVNFTNQQVADATGLSVLVVGALRNQVTDPAKNLCAGITS